MPRLAVAADPTMPIASDLRGPELLLSCFSFQLPIKVVGMNDLSKTLTFLECNFHRFGCTVDRSIHKRSLGLDPRLVVSLIVNHCPNEVVNRVRLVSLWTEEKG